MASSTLVFSGKGGGDKDLVIHAGDYRTVCITLHELRNSKLSSVIVDWRAVRDTVECPNHPQRRVERFALHHPYCWGSKLPASIGRLTKLKQLCLCNSYITVLPPSIGQLKSLQFLSLNITYLDTLPKEIGQLESLEEFTLAHSRLRTLPEEIGQLKRLRILGLNGTLVTKLPDAIYDLTELEQLDLDTEPLVENCEYDYTFALMLADRLPKLVYLGHELESICKMIPYALECNAAKRRIGFGAEGQWTMDLVRIWPRILNRASCAFSRPFVNQVDITLPDAIYQLLLHGRESFIVTLINGAGNGRRSSW